MCASADVVLALHTDLLTLRSFREEHFTRLQGVRAPSPRCPRRHDRVLTEPAPPPRRSYVSLTS
jgi:hypothetical protein